MRNHGIGPEVWRHIKNTNKPTICMVHMEKLCLMFNCSPDDLFSWSGSITQANGLEKHPLQKFRRDDAGSIFNKLSKLPANKIEKLRHLMDQLAQEE